MACEKLCKAYLSHHKVDPTLLANQSCLHCAKNLASEIFQNQYGDRSQATPAPYSALLKQVKNLSREIELLAPTVDSLRLA